MQIKMRHIWSYFLQLITMCWKYSLYILLLSLFQTNLKFIFYVYLIKSRKVLMDIENVDRYGWLSSLSDGSNLIKYISVSFCLARNAFIEFIILKFSRSLRWWNLLDWSERYIKWGHLFMGCHFNGKRLTNEFNPRLSTLILFESSTMEFMQKT